MPLVFAGGRAGLAATQWARSANGRFVVAFDGAIYNRAALLAEPGSASSPPPDATGDAALVLALYAQHGAACVERLRGPFALAVWDERVDGNGVACLLARDPMGLRTLYYFHDEPGGRLLFASGVRPLAASGLVPRQLDARGLYGFFRRGAVPEPFSMVAGIRALETGERLVWQAGRFTRDRFRALPRFAASAGTHPGEDAKSLRAALLDSVDHHLADGKPAGVFVGGGIGSAAILALARETGREKNLRALTLGFDDALPGESELARRTAEHFGVSHTPLRLDRERARAWFDDFLPGLDQPGVHGFPWFALCRFAREEGINVALAGLGAGELLGDTLLHTQLPRLMGWSRRLGPLRPLPGRMLLLAASRPSRQRLADFLTRPPTLAGAYAALRGIHTAEEARAMVARFADPTGCADPPPEDTPGAMDFPTAADEINALELRRLRDQILRTADTSSRAHALDLRLPFVDEWVRETFARIPAGVRLRGDRRLLRDAVPEIPSWVGADAGGGLRFPYDAWRAGEWGAAKPADAAGGRTRRAWEQKWSLFLFRRWWRQVSSG